MRDQSRSSPLPALIVHADWGSNPRKRWMACAALRPDGYYFAQAPQPVGETANLLERLRQVAGPHGTILLGFDFPIGLPYGYAQQCGIQDFVALLPRLGKGKWADFYQPAERADQISLYRPFYPRRPGEARQVHLLEKLGVKTMNDLRRLCELPHPGRRAAAPLFWTLGGQQVGKAAISGWRDVLGPGLASGAGIDLWPFAGSLFELFRPGRIVVAETYPAEVYGHLGLQLQVKRQPSHPTAGKVLSRITSHLKTGKRSQAARASNAARLFDWAYQAGLVLSASLQAAIQDGFGSSPGGEDPFDALVGLFGMLNVVLGRRAPGDPQEFSGTLDTATIARLNRIEGWILGQSLQPVL